MMFWAGSAERQAVHEVQNLAAGLGELMDEGHCSKKVARIVVADILDAMARLTKGLGEEDE